MIMCYDLYMVDFSLFGLNTRDRRVYEALVTNPESSIRTLADATGINRGSVFESIKSLMRAGLVTHIVAGKRLKYRAKDPNVLHEIITEQEHRFADARPEVDRYIASLLPAATDTERFHFTSFYEGDEGLAAILRDVLKTCRLEGVDMYRVLSSPRVSRYLYNNFPYFTRERIRQGLFVRVLRQMRTDTKEADLAESRYLSEDATDTGCYTIIYGSKVAVILLDDVNRTSGIIIDSAGFSQLQRTLFNSAWHLSR